MTINPAIRPATPTDAPAIVAIWNPVIRDTTITFDRVQKSEDDVTALIADRQVALLPQVGRRDDRWIDLILLQKML